jgi:hypothetical protein
LEGWGARFTQNLEGEACHTGIKEQNSHVGQKEHNGSSWCAWSQTKHLSSNTAEMLRAKGDAKVKQRINNTCCCQ